MRSRLAVAKAINPGSGEEDLMGALRYVLKKLSEEEDCVKGGFFHSVPGAMGKRLNSLGIPETYRADFMLVMQETGIARMFGSAKSCCWEFLCVTFMDEMLTEQVLNKALPSIAKRHKHHKDLRRLKRGTDMPSDTQGGYVDSLLQNLAQAVVKYKQLQQVNESLQKKIDCLEEETSCKKASPADVAAELMSQFA